MGAFTISADRDTVSRGETVEITFTDSENALNYDLYIDPVDENGNGIDVGFERRWDWSGEGRAILYTATMPQGLYRLVGHADAPGYGGYNTDWDGNEIILTVTDAQMPEEGLLFTLNGESGEVFIESGEPFELAAYAPGASWIDVFFDLATGDGWREHWDGDAFSNPRQDYNGVGDYNLVAQAWYPRYDENNAPVMETDEEGNEYHVHDMGEAAIAVHVTAPNGDLKFGEIVTADYLTGSENGDGVLVFPEDSGFGFEVKLPENADSMDAGVSVDGWDGDVRYDRIDRDPDNEENNVIGIGFSAEDLNGLQLRDGDVIRVWASAYGRGYNPARFERRIPVMAQAEDAPTLAFREHEGDSLDGIAVNEGVDFVVRPAEGKEIQTVQWYHGNGYRDNHEGPDGDGCYYTGESWGEPGTYTVYARVTYDPWKDEWNDLDYDPRAWLSTNALTVTVDQSNGPVGPFDISVDPIRVARGGMVTVTFGTSDHADGYNLNHNSLDGQEYDMPWSWSEDNHIAVFSTAGMPEGRYRLSGCAWGTGYEGTDSNTVEIEVTEYEGNRVQLSLDRIEILTNENLVASVYAPGALNVGLEIDGMRHDLDEEGNPCWQGEFAICDWARWNSATTLTAVPWAEFPLSEQPGDTEWVSGNPATITVQAHKGVMPLHSEEVPGSLTAGEPTGFTIYRDENASYLEYELRLDGADWDIARSDGNMEGDIHVDLDGNYEVGDVIYLHVWTGGVDYEHNDTEFRLPVLAPASQDVTLAVTTADEYLVHTDYTVTVTAEGAQKVRFNDGHGFQTHDVDGTEVQEFDVDENGQCQFGLRHWDVGKHTIYAMATFDGENWVNSESLTFDFTTDGLADVTWVGMNQYIWAGQDCVITVDGPGESWYDFQLLPQDRNWDNRLLNFMYRDEPSVNDVNAEIVYAENGDATITIPGDQLAEGTYVVSVGFDGPGKGRNTVEQTFQVTTPSVELTTDKRVYYYNDEIAFRVEAPLAESVKLYKGETELNDLMWRANEVNGAITFTAVAEFEGMDEPMTAEVTLDVRSLGATPEPPIEIPDEIHTGESLLIQVGEVAPEGGWRTLYVDGEETGIGEDFKATLEGLDVGAHAVRVEFGAYGYDNDARDYTVAVTDHDYLTEVTEPTCEAQGYTTYTCYQCGHSYVDDYVDALGHSWGKPTFEWSDDYSSATATRVCGNDNSHNWEQDAEVTTEVSDATCTDVGETVYTATATFDGKAYTDTRSEEIPVKPHALGDWQIVWDGDAAAHAERHCGNCDYTETSDVTVTGTDDTATCTEAGSVTYTATLVLDDVTITSDEKTVETEPLGHDWNAGEETTAPGCESKGETTYTCARCDETYTEAIPATGHRWGEFVTTTEPGCETPGEQTSTCENGCGRTVTKFVPALGHLWSNEVTEDSYNWDNCPVVTATRVCERDASHTEQVTAVATGSEAKAPTCTEPGDTLYTAEFKKAPFTTQRKIVEGNIPALGHKLVAHEKVEATCTATGTEAYWACEVCNKLFSDAQAKNEITAPVTIEMKAHTLTAHAQVDKTCTTDGMEAYWTCEVCNKLFSDENGQHEISAPAVIPASHTLTAHAKVDSTCTATGTETYWTCEACEKLFSDENAQNEITEPVVIENKAHTLAAHAKVDSTCAATGTEAYWECGVCNKLFSDAEAKNEITAPVEIEKKAHMLTAHAKVDSTCAATGTEAYWECGVCNKLFSDAEAKNEITAPVEIEKKAHMLTAHAKVDSTCAATGTEAYWSCEVCKKLFSDAGAKSEIPAPVAIAAKGHDWNAPIYTWSNDNSSVTATATCKNGDHPLTEKVKTTSATEAPTYTKKGATTYTAKFENALFADQTKTVDIPMLVKDAAVLDVEAAIKALNSSAGLDDKAAVEAARKAYDSLTDAQKKQVDAGLLDKLTGAEQKVQEAVKKAEEEAARKKAEEDKAAADKVIKAIKALGTEVGLDDKDAVTTARAAYDALTDDQKKLVSEDVVKMLTAAEEQVKAAEEAAKTVNIADCVITVEDQTYTGKALTPAVTVKYGATTLKEDTDYTLTYKDNTNVGTATVTVTGKGSYTGSKAVKFKIAAVKMAELKYTVKNQTYTGKALKPAVTVKYGTVTLKKNTDYTLSYKDNKKAGTATVTVTGKGNYTGSKAVKFKIAAVKMAKLKYTVKDQTYSGKTLSPVVTVKFGATKLKKDTDYTVTYKNNKNVGLATITVTGKGNFTGSKKVTFKINPKGTVFTKLTGGKQQVALKWKNPKNITGYEIQYSLKKDFSGSKTVTVKKAKTLATTIKKLKENKTYYVRIRTYATVSKKTYYSEWSKAKSVKTKAASANGETADEGTQTIEEDPDTGLDELELVIELEMDDVINEEVGMEEAGLLLEQP